MKQLFKFFGTLAVGAAVMIACSDDFNEEDFVKLQSDLSKQASDENAEALALASLLQSFTVQVQEDEAPLEGVTVTISNPGAAETTATTNANGNAIFSDVVIGGNTINVSLDGYLSSQVVVDFGDVEEGDEYQIINGRIVPIPRSESIVIPMISENATSGSTATITGKVSIESDLTNTEKEVPQDIQIRANFDDVLEVTGSDGVDVSSYTFNEGLGIADVDNSTGEYTLLIPAGADGTDVELIFPEISMDQTVAIDELDGDVVTPEYRSVPTLFGPDAGAYDGIPDVYGVMAIFPEPAAAGQGFALSNFARVGRELAINADVSTTATISDDTRFRFTSLGAGYTQSPTVNITDANGSGATGEGWIEFAIGGINVTTTGTGYGASTPVDVDLYYLDESGSDNFINTITVTTNASGEITQAVVTTAVQDAIDADATGFEIDDLFEINEISTGFRVDFPAGGGTDAEGTITLSKSQIHHFAATGGDGYTSPSITFSGGGASSQAVVEIIAFGTQWSFDLDNSGNTTDYNVLFDDITFVKETASLASLEDDDVESTLNGSINDLLNLLAVESGDVVFYDVAEDYITEFRSISTPTFIIEMRDNQIAEADVDINTDGEVTDLTVNDTGAGYAGEFQVTITPSITGAPGTNATFSLEDFQKDDQTGEVVWDGDYFLTNMGSGYLDNLNQATLESFSGTATLTLRSGETKVLNVAYGTGNRLEDVD